MKETEIGNWKSTELQHIYIVCKECLILICSKFSSILQGTSRSTHFTLLSGLGRFGIFPLSVPQIAAAP